jgi:O-antigen/teichoic acid export membrane protein
MNSVIATATLIYLAIVVPIGIVIWNAIGLIDLHVWLPAGTSEALSGIAPSILRTTIVLVLASVPFAAFAATLSGARLHHVRLALDAALPIATLVALTFSLAFRGGIWAASLTAPLATIAGGCIAYLLMRRMIPGLRLRFSDCSAREARHIVRHSFYFLLISFSFLSNRSVPTLLAGLIGTQSEVSQVFAAALVFRALGWAALDSITRVLQPDIILEAHLGRSARVWDITHSAFLATNAAAFVFAAFMVCFGSSLSSLWLGATGRIDSTVISAMSVAFLLDISLLPVNNTLIALNRHKRLAIGLFVQPIAMVAITLIAGRLQLPSAPLWRLLLGIVGGSALTFIVLVTFVARNGLADPADRFAQSFLGPAAYFLTSLVFVVSAMLWLREAAGFIVIAMFFVFVSLVLFGAWRIMPTEVERQWAIGALDRLQRGFVPRSHGKSQH